MKYKEVYLALNQRKLDAPGFHYSDYSGWRAANQSYMTRQRPLWICLLYTSDAADEL